MHKNYYRAFCLFMFSILAGESALGGQDCSVNAVALTWNMGNSTAEGDVVNDMVQEITAKDFPDVILVGTQEEMATKERQLNQQLLDTLNKGPVKYFLQQNESHLTLAGGNSKKGLKMIFQNRRELQNRTSLTILAKTGVALENIQVRIDYPPGKKKSNNSFIVIEGKLKKGACHLPMAIASVHLSSKTDQKRRLHANVFLGKNFSPLENSYEDLLKASQRFNLIMGDFNERDYLMKDVSVSDRGFLTNFMAHGYDFSQPQERPSFVYGTYGFTQVNDKLLKKQKVETIRDPRGRPHNAKGGYLDRITFTSGFSVLSDAGTYGPLTKYHLYEYKGKNGKHYYSTSDHVPVVRFFTITSPENELSFVRNYVKRLLPNFGPDIAQLDKNAFGFHDEENPTVQFSSAEREEKLKAMRGLAENIKVLSSKLEGSDKPFLLSAHNRIKECNLARNASLLDQNNSKAQKKPGNAGVGEWFIPASLTMANYTCYSHAVNDLIHFK